MKWFVFILLVIIGCSNDAVVYDDKKVIQIKHHIMTTKWGGHVDAYQMPIDGDTYVIFIKDGEMFVVLKPERKAEAE